MKSAIKSTKLDPQFVGPFEIVEKKSLVAYKLALPPSLLKIHDVFQVSLMRNYVSKSSLMLDLSDV